MERRGTHICYWWGSQREGVSRPRCRWMDNIRMDLGEIGWGLLTELVWLRMGTTGELL
jgi:hypothetical protein